MYFAHPEGQTLNICSAGSCKALFVPLAFVSALLNCFLLKLFEGVLRYLKNYYQVKVLLLYTDFTVVQLQVLDWKRTHRSKK